jgi:hypothetical protein
MKFDSLGENEVGYVVVADTLSTMFEAQECLMQDKENLAVEDSKMVASVSTVNDTEVLQSRMRRDTVSVELDSVPEGKSEHSVSSECVDAIETNINAVNNTEVARSGRRRGKPPKEMASVTEGQDGLIPDGESLAVLRGLPLVYTSLEDAQKRDPRCNRVIEDFEKDFVLATDASDKAVSAVLNQRVNGELAPVAYYSRLLSLAERRYSTYEKECLAVVFGCEKARTYLEHKEFELHCDNLALCWLFRNVKEVGRLGRWILRLSPFRFKLRGQHTDVK